MGITTKKFTVMTDDGKKFCQGFIDENGEATYESKDGKVKMSSLMQQTYGVNPNVGRRGRRAV